MVKVEFSPQVVCPNSADHGILHIFVDDTEPYYKCLGCGGKWKLPTVELEPIPQE